MRAGTKQYGTGNREWIFLECDGVPFNLITDIISNVWRCSCCSQCFYGKNFLDGHKCVVLQKGTGDLEFGWLIPIAGLLHIEINIAQAFMNLNWEVFTKECGRILGFQTPKSQKYLKKGSDHHKTWHFLEILYVAVALELLVPYVESNGSTCLLYTSPSPRDATLSRMPSSA